MSAKLFFCGLT